MPLNRHEAHVERAAQQLQTGNITQIPLVPVCILKGSQPSHHIILLLLCTSMFIKTVLAVLKPKTQHV